MSDTELEALYKAALPQSHFAGLRAVYDAGLRVGSQSTEQEPETEPKPKTSSARGHLDAKAESVRKPDRH